MPSEEEAVVVSAECALPVITQHRHCGNRFQKLPLVCGWVIHLRLFVLTPDSTERTPQNKHLHTCLVHAFGCFFVDILLVSVHLQQLFSCIERNGCKQSMCSHRKSHYISLCDQCACQCSMCLTSVPTIKRRMLHMCLLLPHACACMVQHSKRRLS